MSSQTYKRTAMFSNLFTEHFSFPPHTIYNLKCMDCIVLSIEYTSNFYFPFVVVVVVVIINNNFYFVAKVITPTSNSPLSTLIENFILPFKFNHRHHHHHYLNKNLPHSWFLLLFFQNFCYCFDLVLIIVIEFYLNLFIFTFFCIKNIFFVLNFKYFLFFLKKKAWLTLIRKKKNIYIHLYKQIK